MQWILPRTSLCLSSLPWVRGCVALLPQKQRMWTVSHHLFPVLSRPCNGATCAGSASYPCRAIQHGTPALGCKGEGSEWHQHTQWESHHPAWPGEVKGTPGVMYSKGWCWPASTSHGPDELWGPGLVRGKEGSQIHFPRKKSPWKDFKNGIIQQFGILGHWSALLALNFSCLIHKTGGHRP